MDNTKQPAFPYPDERYFGLSKLEYFTAMAMQGIVSAISNAEMSAGLSKLAESKNVSNCRAISSMALELAKETLKQLDQEK